jgi:hypothetical protein
MPVIPATERLRQEDQKFKASRAWLFITRPYLKKPKTNKKDNNAQGFSTKALIPHTSSRFHHRHV